MGVCWNTSSIDSGMCPPSMLSFLQKLWTVFNISASFFHNRFLLPSLWTSSLTLQVLARLRKRSSQFQTSLLYVKNLISPSRSICSSFSHPISVDPQSNRHNLAAKQKTNSSVKQCWLVHSVLPSWHKLILDNIIKSNRTHRDISHPSAARCN